MARNKAHGLSLDKMCVPRVIIGSERDSVYAFDYLCAPKQRAMDNLASFLQQISAALQADDFIKLSLGNYHGEDVGLKNTYVKLVEIKREHKLSFTMRYQTRDITKNYTLDEGTAAISRLLSESGFWSATLFTPEANIACQRQKNGIWQLKRDKATAKKPLTLSHDVQKERKLANGTKRYLQELRLTDAEGNVFKNAQDKWRQINHYIEILSSMLLELPKDKKLNVVDMGAGKGYLTFALYDYLRNVLDRDAAVVGVEYREDLVDLCNDVARRSDFGDLSFVQGTIEGYAATDDLSVLIALHACDTATDDAIAKGIQHNADLIVVAPCCHKQIRREMERVKAENELDFLLKHGIFLERQAEMLTDGLRALIMEYHGYQSKVFQFVSDAHTPKNVLVVGVKKAVDPERQALIKTKIQESKAYFGIGYHHLERLLDME